MGKSTTSEEIKGIRKLENQTFKGNRKISPNGGGGRGLVAESRLTLSDPVGSSLSGFSAHDLS